MTATATATTTTLVNGAQVAGGYLLLNGAGHWYVSFQGQDISRTGMHTTPEGAAEEAASVAAANAEYRARDEAGAARDRAERADREARAAYYAAGLHRR